MKDGLTAIATTTSISAFTLVGLDLARTNSTGNTDVGVAANRYWHAAAGTLLVRAEVTMFETSGGTYSSTWEKTACYRVSGASVPTLKGSIVDGNAASGGILGDPDTSTITLDVSGTTIRLRVTPSGTSSRDWYGAIWITGYHSWS